MALDPCFCVSARSSESDLIAAASLSLRDCMNLLELIAEVERYSLRAIKLSAASLYFPASIWRDIVA